jgi:hypothetical protein
VRLYWADGEGDIATAQYDGTGRHDGQGGCVLVWQSDGSAGARGRPPPDAPR